MLEKAILIAVNAHLGQRDKAQSPYILHPLRLMFKVSSDVERIAAVLHDIVEDTDWTLEKLAIEGISEEVLEAVDCLTHRDGEPYDDYLLRVQTNKGRDCRKNRRFTRQYGPGQNLQSITKGL